jgi:hypothetical protein
MAGGQGAVHVEGVAHHHLRNGEHQRSDVEKHVEPREELQRAQLVPSGPSLGCLVSAEAYMGRARLTQAVRLDDDGDDVEQDGGDPRAERLQGGGGRRARGRRARDERDVVAVVDVHLELCLLGIVPVASSPIRFVAKPRGPAEGGKAGGRRVEACASGGIIGNASARTALGRRAVIAQLATGRGKAKIAARERRETLSSGVLHLKARRASRAAAGATDQADREQQDLIVFQVCTLSDPVRALDDASTCRNPAGQALLVFACVFLADPPMQAVRPIPGSA